MSAHWGEAITYLLAACGTWQLRTWAVAGLDKLNAHFKRRLVGQRCILCGLPRPMWRDGEGHTSGAAEREEEKP